MSEIQTFPFRKEKFDQVRAYKYGTNWPVVYLLENGREIYIGETTSAYTRSKQHNKRAERSTLKNLHIISDEEFNKSANLDIESWLIQFIAADGIYRLQNGNAGLKNHNYFDREKYKAKFEVIWKKLQELSIVKQDLVQLRNTDLFKYSPYKALGEDQIAVVSDLLKSIKTGKGRSFIIKGKPGTGKTVLATYLVKFLLDRDETKDLKIGLVVPMTSLRQTLKKVFRRVNGLNAQMVIGPADVVREKYDLLLVDEAHRLKRRVNITNYGIFDKINSLLGFGNEGTELDWIIASSRQQVFFYDPNQSVRPADIRPESFKKLGAVTYELASQMRVEGGEKYVQFIDDLLDLRPASYSPQSYDFKIYDDIHQLVADIKQQDTNVGLSRVVAGYAWRWNTRDGGDYDIDIDGLKLSWNRTTSDWVNSPNAVNEVGCIHTVQGYDLNYAGVIIGPEISYNQNTNQLEVDAGKYEDLNGKKSISHPEELNRYVINIYKTLLTRGIKGTYVYISDPNLRELFKRSLTS